MSTFLDGVNRVLKINGIIAGDDDNLTSFTDTQHRETMNLAQISIQSALNDLVASRLIPYEETLGELTTVASQRLYTLPSDFIRFVGENPFLLELSGTGGTSENQTINQYPGGEENLRRNILDYKDQTGTPRWWYFKDSTTKQIGLYQVPDTSGTVYEYPYERNVYVTAESDILPFHNTQEDHAFLGMAAQYFFYLFSKAPISSITEDPIYKMSKTTVIQLMKGRDPATKYGVRYI